MTTATPSNVVLEDVSRLPTRFDDGASSLRVLLLVSPTCPVCRAGVELVLATLDEGDLADAVDIHLVWLAVLDADDLDAVTEGAATVGNRPRTTHYFDAERAISSAVHETLNLGRWNRRTAWDLYLVFRAGITWAGPAPLPDIWFHQLGIDDQPSLEAAAFRTALEQLVEPANGL